MVFAKEGQKPVTIKTWAAKGDRGEETYAEFRVVTNAQFGKDAEGMWINVKMRRSGDVDICKRLKNKQRVLLEGELTQRTDDKGRIWLNMNNATFFVWPDKSEMGEAPAEDADEAEGGRFAPAKKSGAGKGAPKKRNEDLGDPSGPDPEGGGYGDQDGDDGLPF